MITRFLLLLSLVGVVSLPAQEPISRLRQAVQQTNGRVIITLKQARPDSTPAIRQRGDPSVNRNEQRSIVTRLRRDHGGRTNIRFAVEETAMVVADIDPAKLAEILADSNVASVEPDRLWRQSETIDISDRWAAYHSRAQETPYGIPQVTAPETWAQGYRGAGVKVAVLDSGIDIDHPDLTLAGGYNTLTRLESGYDDDIAPCNGHGTHIAGTIAARDNDIGVIGVAPEAQLYAIKVFEDIGGQCLAYTSSQIVGLNWAVTKGVRLVNVSIGGGQSYSWDSAAQTALAQGTYVIAAAGNNGGAMLFPGSSIYAVGVGAVDGSNTKASWSSYGPELDVVAPGVGINSTMPGGGYGGKSGTSMATPHVVGVAALLLHATPSLTFDQLRQKLIDGALDLETAGFNNTTGYGLTRAFNSLGPIVPPALPTLVVTPLSARTSVVLGGVAPNGSTAITFTGTGNAPSWTATNSSCTGMICPPIWATVVTPTGTGNGTVSWTRNAAGRPIGNWVNTISIAAGGATGSPKVFTDTLTIIAAPVCTLGVSGATTRNYTVAVQGMTRVDTAAVTGTCAWTANSSRTPLTISGNLIIFTASATDTIRVIKQ